MLGGTKRVGFIRVDVFERYGFGDAGTWREPVINWRIRNTIYIITVICIW